MAWRVSSHACLAAACRTCGSIADAVVGWWGRAVIQDRGDAGVAWAVPAVQLALQLSLLQDALALPFPWRPALTRMRVSWSGLPGECGQMVGQTCTSRSSLRREVSRALAACRGSL
eukprot:6007406-Prymnesium_polylepis.1